MVESSADPRLRYRRAAVCRVDVAAALPAWQRKEMGVPLTHGVPCLAGAARVTILLVATVAGGMVASGHV